MTNVLKSGQLQKYKTWMNWTSKSFVLTSECLSHNTLSGNDVHCHLKNVSIFNETGNAFTILDTSRQKKLYLKASCFEDKTNWINAINSQKANILYYGSLKKWTNVLKGWQTRYFILYNNRLCYYLNEDSLVQRRGTTHLVDKNATVTDSVTKHGFDVMTESTIWYLKANTLEQQQVWTTKITQIICSIKSSEDEKNNESTCTPASINSLSSASSLTNSTNKSRDEDSDQESNYRKDLECTICLDLLHEPTTLSCGHTYCRNCLADLWESQKDRFQCPSCRKSIQSVPETNISLQNLIPVLYENIKFERDKSEYREAFDKQFRGEPLTLLDRTTGRTFQFRGFESLLFKLGLCSILTVWFFSTMSYLFNSSFDTSNTEEIDAYESNTTTSYQFIDSRNSLIFVLIGALHCPRWLGGYIFIFNYSDIAYPMVKTVSQIMNQIPSYTFHLHIVVWGAIVPYAWFVPIYLYEAEFQLGLLVGLLSLIEGFDVVLLCKHCLTIPSHDRYEHVKSLIRQECSECCMKLVHARAIAWLPWSWVPDVIFYCVILYVVSENVSYHLARVKGFFQLRSSFVRD